MNHYDNQLYIILLGVDLASAVCELTIGIQRKEVLCPESCVWNASCITEARASERSQDEGPQVSIHQKTGGRGDQQNN